MREKDGVSHEVLATLDLPRAERDRQLSPSQSAKDAVGVLARLAALTAAAKTSDSLSVRGDFRYGSHPRQRLDVFRPKEASGAQPAVVFLHGGFWQEGDKSVSGFAAEALAAQGWATVAVGYSLTPAVTLAEIVEEIHAAVTFIHQEAGRFGLDPARLVLVGHSAGGHLAAAILAGLQRRGTSPPVAGAVLISGVFDLAPIAQSYVADLTPLTEQDVEVLSPARFPPRVICPVHLVVGADEPDAFLRQTSALERRWAPSLGQLNMHLAPGRDHFDVLYELLDPGSVTMGWLRGMA